MLRGAFAQPLPGSRPRAFSCQRDVHEHEDLLVGLVRGWSREFETRDAVSTLALDGDTHAGVWRHAGISTGTFVEAIQPEARVISTLPTAQH